MHPFDDLDKNLLTALSKDSSESIPLLAKKLGTKQSVLYGRIKRLRSAGVIEKFTIIVNDKVLGIGVKATCWHIAQQAPGKSRDSSCTR